MGIRGGRCGYCGEPPQINQRVGNRDKPKQNIYISLGTELLAMETKSNSRFLYILFLVNISSTKMSLLVLVYYNKPLYLQQM